MRFIDILRYGAIITPAILCPYAASAQTASTGAGGEKGDAGVSQIEEVVVTATRREETLSKVPLSVTAITQRRLDDQGVKRIDDIARLAPGITFSRSSGLGNGTQSNVSIRGISSTAGAATTGIYIDDTPIQMRAIGSSSGNAYPEVFDLERVEVLRGPQGTLFGAGAEGGVIRFITPQPNLQRYSAYGRSELSFTEGGAPSYETGVALGGPIKTDVLGFRGSAYIRHDGGWVDRVNFSDQRVLDKNANDQDALVLRGALAWAPVEGLTVTPSVQYQKVNSGDTSLFFESLSDSGRHEFSNGRPLRQNGTDRFLLPNLKIDYDLGGVKIVSNTSYFDRKSSNLYDYTSYDQLLLKLSPFPLLAGQNAPTRIINQQENFTQEVRVQSTGDGPFTWIVGGFYAKNRQHTSQVDVDTFFDQLVAIRTNGLPGCPVGGCNTQQFTGVALLPGSVVFQADQVTHDEQLAGFAEASYEVLKGLKATAGVRVARTKFDFAAVAEGPLAGGRNVTSGVQKESPVTPKFALSYQVDDDTLLYTSATKGYRIGGAQVVPSSRCGADLATLGLTAPPPTYNSDSVWSYEAGAKSRLLNGRLQVEGSVFQIDWSNIQQRVPLPSCGSAFVTNLGSATVKGFDLAVQARLAEGLSVGGTLGYTNGVFDETVRGGGTSIIAAEGDKIPGVAPWSGTLFARYDFTAASHDAYVRADYRYISKGPAQNPLVFGYDPQIYRNGETNLISLRAGMKFEEIEASVFVNNLMDDNPVLSRGHDVAGSTLYYQSTYRPRTVGVTITYRK